MISGFAKPPPICSTGHRQIAAAQRAQTSRESLSAVSARATSVASDIVSRGRTDHGQILNPRLCIASLVHRHPTPSHLNPSDPLLVIGRRMVVMHAFRACWGVTTKMKTGCTAQRPGTRTTSCGGQDIRSRSSAPMPMQPAHPSSSAQASATARPTMLRRLAGRRTASRQLCRWSHGSAANVLRWVAVGVRNVQ